MKVKIRRVSSIFSLRKWKDVLTRGENWFIAFGRLYVVDFEGTELLQKSKRNHPHPGREGRLFRSANARRPAQTRHLDSVLISGLGRFGNGVQQFVHATSFALETGASNILFFPNESTSHSSTDGGSRIPLRAISWPLLPTYRAPNTVWRSDFFEAGRLTHTFEERASNAVRPALRSIYASLLDTQIVGEETLTIHLRSGDVFGVDPHPRYGQPPLAFYQKVIDSENWTEVQIVSEDSLNPCQVPLLDYLEARGIPSTVSGAALAEATRALARAHNLVASRGTFAPAVLFLSSARKRVFVFGGEIDEIPGAPNHSYLHVLDIEGSYIKEVLSSNWANSPAQRQMMLDYPQSNLSEPSRPRN